MVRSIRFKFNPFELAGIEAPRGAGAAEVREEIADAILEQVLDYVGGANSPVGGQGKFKSLSKEYKKVKAEISSSVIPNLELHGDMLDALECVNVGGNKFELRITDPKQAKKADGHHGGNKHLPVRPFIPEKGQTFKRDILGTIRSIAREFEDDG